MGKRHVRQVDINAKGDVWWREAPRADDINVWEEMLPEWKEWLGGGLMALSFEGWMSSLARG